MDLIERFLKYVSFDTQSDETSGLTPSSEKQWSLAKYLKNELDSIGLSDVTIDNNAYVMATLPSNTSDDVPTIGFISHMDTSPDMGAENVKPRIVKNYEGNDIVLNEAENIVMSPSVFPELKNHVGEDLIVTDGTSLLGADDKAGIAEIVTAMQYLLGHPEIKHGKIRIAFNPDEEIGLGAAKFDVNKFACDWAYTIDGGEAGELEYENFNAASARVVLNGTNVHPGSAKNKMLNSASLGIKFDSLLPEDQRPQYTEGYEGFFHLISFKGSVEETVLNYIIRDHDKLKFEKRIQLMQDIAGFMNVLHPGAVNIEIKRQYKNMKEVIEPKMHIVRLAFKAMTECGIKPDVSPIRGGTDGAQLSFKGLPCPNIFAGGMNMHGRYEYVPVQSMEKAMQVIVKIAELNVEESGINR